jgi:hypothetical protein
VILQHGGFKAPTTMTGQRRGVTLETYSFTMIILPYSGQWWVDNQLNVRWWWLCD